MERNCRNELICYPAPENAALRNDYTVYVRPVGKSEWTELPCYEVKVDMHDVRKASMAYFDFAGRAEVKIRYNNYMDIYSVDIRPLSRNIKAAVTEREAFFTLEQPANLSIEMNGDRFHNLHLFAGKPPENRNKQREENVKSLAGNLEKPAVHNMNEVTARLKRMPAGRTLYFEPGIHYFEECTMNVPSDTDIVIAGGAVVVGSFLCQNAENIRIYGRGVVYLADFQRFTALRGIRLSHVRNVEIEGITFINPPHYTVYIGNAEHISVRNIKSFSCEGWSDGIDIMSSKDITIDHVFMRNSDDCVAVYGGRWEYNGNTRNILVKDSVLWADVAHPTNIGCHGDYQKEGNLIENISFRNIDILEHHEPQKECLGCMCINAGDSNSVRNVSYENIRIERMEHGKLLDLQIIRGRYNPVPGRLIENISFKDIYYDGNGEVSSEIAGYDEDRRIKNIYFENFFVRGKKTKNMEEANIKVGQYASDIFFE